MKTPYEMWTGKKPNLEHVRIFGSIAYAHVPKQSPRKLDDKSKKLLMVQGTYGYQGDSSNYKFYDPATKRVIVSRDVVFDEFHDDQTSRADRDKGTSTTKIGTRKRSS